MARSGNTNSSFDYLTSNYTYIMNDWGTGRYKIRAKYSKSSTVDAGQDSGYIKPSTYFKEDNNGTETVEIDQKSKIHDGGFVIYQLTDAEIETNPNGTSVIINDTNKDTAQSTRNQYVWVPVPNIEDITRTKIENNGIMQFGQSYVFNRTSITKETSTNSGFFSEPRLASYDKTKYYLQRYSNIDKKEDYLNNMQEEYARMIKSINKYKGFYIGRYETGDDYTHSSSKGYFTNPRIVRYNGNISCVTWYDSYKELERLSKKTGKYVETGMIYYCLWDYTLIWLHETDTRSYEDLAVDSGTWGNYSNNGKTVISGNTNPAKTGSIETIIYDGEIYGDDPTSSNNIFEIAGNLREWDRSTFSDKHRSIRGGSYSLSSNLTASSSYTAEPNISYATNYGVRALLLIR